MPHYEFLMESDEPLIKFKYGGAFRLSAQVEIVPRARELPELPILVLFGGYLAVMCYTWTLQLRAAVRPLEPGNRPH